MIDTTIPVGAARFVASAPFVFAAGDGGESEGVPVRLHARDAKPIDHWYWGKIAHDMSGVIHRDSLAIDWRHDAEQLLGYVDDVQADAKKGLDLGGMILPKLDEKAAEIARKADAGVPYESSIDWTGPAVIEYVDTGASAEVNGYTFEGPGYIAREWHLRGVAICPHGADVSTTTEFSADDEVGVRVFTQKGTAIMPTTQSQQSTKDQAHSCNSPDQAESQTQDSQSQGSGTATPESAAPAGTQDSAGGADPEPAESAAPAAADNERATQGQRFTAAFGEGLGAKLFAKGLSFEGATVEHAKQLTADNAKLQEDVAQLKQQVGTLREHAGEADPATFTPEGGKATGTEDSQDSEPDNAQRFAAAITLPK